MKHISLTLTMTAATISLLALTAPSANAADSKSPFSAPGLDIQEQPAPQSSPAQALSSLKKAISKGSWVSSLLKADPVTRHATIASITATGEAYCSDNCPDESLCRTKVTHMCPVRRRLLCVKAAGQATEEELASIKPRHAFNLAAGISNLFHSREATHYGDLLCYETKRLIWVIEQEQAMATLG